MIGDNLYIILKMIALSWSHDVESKVVTEV